MIEYGDTDANTPRSEGSAKYYETDLSDIADWDLLKAVNDRKGQRVLRAPSGGTFDFLPAVHGDAIRISGSDAAVVIYRTADGMWYERRLATERVG